MENNLQISDDPRKLPFKLIKKITNDFAEDRILGRGAFGTVYKGVNEDGEHIAVKVLHSFLQGIDGKQFKIEFDNLKRLEHPNIVRLVGICDETEEIVIEHEGRLVNCVKIHRALCLEYVTNGSLGKLLLSGKLRGKSCWPIRYKIIKGICEGLKYLHQGLDNPILHLDLKLDNILLDDEMVPKIADFGLSRLLGEQNTKLTKSELGTPGYSPPEFTTNKVISKEYDIYSLGVVIKKIITCGIVDSEMDTQEFIEHVHDNWMRNLQEVPRCALPDPDCKHAKRCMELAVNCMQPDRRKRPTMKEVVSKLKETEKCHCEESLVLCSPPEEMGEVAPLLALRKIGDVLADETAKAVLAKLSEKVNNLRDLQDKIEQIRMQLTVMNKFIWQFGTVYLTDEVVRGWIGEVRKLAYRVEDVMDKYSYYSVQMEEEWFLKKYFIKGSHYVLIFSQIADEVIKIEKEIKQVIELKEQWLQPSQLVPDHLTEMERQRSQDSFPQLVKDEDLVGIEGNRRMLTEWLYSEELDSTVITVSGMGGLGKTTLVANVYEREKINFPAHAWMVVSQTYTVDALLRKLLRKVGYAEQQFPASIDRMDVYDLKEEIKKMLKNTKCLIVLDDVWNQDVYFQMRNAFQNLEASRIIITTRKNHVAALAHSTRHLDLQPLSKTHAFELFCRRAFHNKKEHECPEELLKIATSIVDRCQGLPLAIVSIGSLLSSRPWTQYIWNQMYNQLRSELSNNDDVRAILNLSYHDLSGDLRNCFLYCSLFPQGYPISRENLVRMWVAEGFVLRKGKYTAEEVAEVNLMELIHRNMLVIVENDDQGRVKTCTMHDIVRELALAVAKEERFGSANDYGTMLQMDRDVRRLSSYEWKDDTTLKVRFPSLRTLVSLGTILASPHMLSSILSESSYLTVLELQDSEVTEVPASIGTLFNLRYIGLRRTKVRSLPESVEKLCNLHTLDIKQTKIEKLPRGIAKVKKLQHLLADRYDDEKHSAFRYFKGMQPPKDLCNLEELQTLETVEANKDLAEQLKKLMQLRTLWIDNISSTDCSSLFATLSDMPLLSSLLLSARDENEALCFDALKPKSTELHKLIIRGQWAEETLKCPIFHGFGVHLKYLAISWCDLREDPLEMLAAHLPNLTNLRLNNMGSAEILALPAGSFPHLKLLVLQQMPNVKELVIGKGAIPCIEGLYITSLPKLDKVPQGIQSLLSLKKLWLLKLHSGFVTQWNESGMHRKLQHVLEIRV